jgi:hypothetical protein
VADGTIFKPGKLTDWQYAGLRDYYQAILDHPVHFRLEQNPPANSSPLIQQANFYSFAFLDGRKIPAFDLSKQASPASSLIKYIHLHEGSQTCGGVVLQIFKHVQDDQSTLFAEVKWMKPIAIENVDGTAWLDTWKDLYVL